MSNWIWLDKNIFSEYACDSEKFCVAEFFNTLNVPKKQKITLKVCADARYVLYINGEFTGRGPVSAGGDFLWPKMTNAYYDEYEIIAENNLEIRAYVTSKPYVLCEYSFGQSGFYFEALSEDETELKMASQWLCRPVSSRISAQITDYTIPEHSFAYATPVPDIYNIERSPIEHLCEIPIEPIKFDKIDLNTTTGTAFFDKIYSAYPIISIKATGRVVAEIESSEADGIGIWCESVITDKDIVYTSPRLRSVGQIKITLKGEGAQTARVDSVKIIYSAYPVRSEAHFKCNEPLINEIYELCMHTLKICRRDIHLDSPTHQEHLACTGDYYIQALMEYFNIYDPSLTKFDIQRTARMLEIQNGRMFHTTYSLIFAEWLYDYYMHTADKALVLECKRAIELLLARFDSYMGENGLVEGAPDYMFVDWILMDEEGNHTDPSNMMSHSNFEGYSLHHPPKALGQGVLCMFYYNALCNCEKLFDILGDSKSADMCLKKAQKLKDSINEHLYDSERGLYLGGLNTPDRAPNGEWLPKNTEKRFYLKQANTLAVLYGIAPERSARQILEYVVKDLKKEEMQPYFYHFLLSALLKENMMAEYGMDLIRRYESLLKKCNKGLSEAWEMFPCDISHAWGGTPAYILKKALSGFEMLEAGYKKVKISPCLHGLECADLAIPTPYGEIEIRINEGGYSYTAPAEIEIETEK